MDDHTDHGTRAAIPEFHISFADQPANDVQALVYQQLGIIADVHRGHQGPQDNPETIVVTTPVPALVEHAIGRTNGRGVERAFEKIIEGLGDDRARIAMEDRDLKITIVWDKAEACDTARAALEFTRTDWRHARRGLTYLWSQTGCHWTAASAVPRPTPGERRS
jgi:hypothetical protein